MIKTLLPLFIITIFSCNDKNGNEPATKASENIPVAKNNDNDLPDSSKMRSVKTIQDAVEKIDGLQFTDSIELENEEFMDNMTDGGGSLTGYFNDDKLVKIKLWVGLSWGVRQDVYYFKDDKLMYVLETEDGFYVDSAGTDHTRFGIRFEGDFYFQEDKLFNYLTLGHNRFEIDENDPEKEFLTNAAYYRKIILSNRKRIN